MYCFCCFIDVLRKKKTIPNFSLPNAVFLIVFACQLLACEASVSSNRNQLMTGVDRLAAGRVSFLNGLRVGVITNQTGVTSNGRHIADVIAENPNIELAALFGPEHGIRGTVEAGDKVDSHVDAKTGAPIYSLYGRTRKPAPEMLAGLDAMVFDIQDIGARFYTYISTMSLAMEAAAENGLKFIVLDRPNPIGGHIVEGPVLDPALESFIGIHPIPQRHGMTVGELAKMFNDEGWLANGVKVDLHVVPCTGWRRKMIFADYGKKWISPSPNIPNANAAILYAGVGLVEMLRTFSEGRGTEAPFEQVGAPWLDSAVLISALRKANLKGVDFEPVEFTPVDIPGKATENKYDRRKCTGVRFVLRDGHVVQSVRLGYHLIAALQKYFPDQLEIKQRSVEKLTGQKWIYQAIIRSTPADSIIAHWQPELDKFLKMREKYLLYR